MRAYASSLTRARRIGPHKALYQPRRGPLVARTGARSFRLYGRLYGPPMASNGHIYFIGNTIQYLGYKGYCIVERVNPLCFVSKRYGTK
jgi:hypothetical protein